MPQNLTQTAFPPNPALQPFSILIGQWNTTGTHGLLPGMTLHGRASIEWAEGGAFLIIRSEVNDPRFPKGIAILGSDDAEGAYYMLTYDNRGVSRKHDVTLRDNVWKWWRNAPGFAQRYEGTIVDGGNTIIGKGELCKDGSTWEKDLDLTYTRVK